MVVFVASDRAIIVVKRQHQLLKSFHCQRVVVSKLSGNHAIDSENQKGHLLEEGLREGSRD
jgi:hypothetical protein